MVVKLKGTVQITIIIAYAPTADKSSTEKHKFYKELQEEYKKAKSAGFAMTIGDFNARIQTKLTKEEECVGPHTLDKENTRIARQPKGIIDNRHNLKFCHRNNSILANTFFYKRPEKLITYKENKSHIGGPPFN